MFSTLEQYSYKSLQFLLFLSSFRKEYFINTSHFITNQTSEHKGIENLPKSMKTLQALQAILSSPVTVTSLWSDGLPLTK